MQISQFNKMRGSSEIVEIEITVTANYGNKRSEVVYKQTDSKFKQARLARIANSNGDTIRYMIATINNVMEFKTRTEYVDLNVE